MSFYGIHPRHETHHQGANDASEPVSGFEATLWAAADKLRGHLDAAEYKHVVLGVIFHQVHLRCL